MDEIEENMQRILVVDDTQKNIQVIGAILREKDYLISIASSGEMALKTIESTTPDLILLDIMMPGIDGYETCKRIKENPETKDIPIIFLSAITETLDKVKAFELGAVDYVTKPIESKELLARVHTHLKIDSLQKELKYINKNLEQLVEIRTHELQQTESYLENVIDSMPSSIIGIDLEGDIINLNEQAERQASLYAGDVERRNVREVFPEFSDYYPEIFAALNKGEIFKHNKIHTQTDSKQRYININVYPLIVKYTVVGGVIRIDDVTEAMKLEKIKNRFEKEKMTALGDIVIGVAHEINTPIGSAITAASFLKGKTENLNEIFHQGNMTKRDFETYMESAQQFETMVLSNMQRVAVLVSHFKEIAVDYDGDKISCFNLRDKINTIIDSLVYEINERKCSIELNCPEEFEIKLQKKSFNQVLGNLLTNSLIHGFEGKDNGVINIDVEANPDVVVIHYSDNGKGIAKEDQDKVFSPFFTTKRGSECVGLGLSILYNLVTLRMEGKIDFSNTPGKGLSFRIELPQVD